MEQNNFLQKNQPRRTCQPHIIIIIQICLCSDLDLYREGHGHILFQIDDYVGLRVRYGYLITMFQETSEIFRKSKLMPPFLIITHS